MLKNLLCGVAAVGLLSQASLANEIIINGVPHHGGSTVNVPYGHGAANCCAVEELPYNPLPVISYETAPVTYGVVPASYETVPVSYETVPAMKEERVYINDAPSIAVAPAAPIATAPVPAVRGWSSRVYVGARGGWSSARDTDFGVGTANVVNDYDDAGYNVAAVVGWGAKVQNSIGYRLEAELGYQTAEVDTHTVGGTRISGSDSFGDTNTLYGFANAYLDIPLFNRLNGIVGGGVGVGKVEFDGHGVRGAGVVMDDEDTAFGYHVDAGLSYDVTDRLALEAMYRYTSFVDVELTSVDGVKSETDVDTHNVVVGARYGF